MGEMNFVSMSPQHKAILSNNSHQCLLTMWQHLQSLHASGAVTSSTWLLICLSAKTQHPRHCWQNQFSLSNVFTFILPNGFISHERKKTVLTSWFFQFHSIIDLWFSGNSQFVGVHLFSLSFLYGHPFHETLMLSCEFCKLVGHDLAV